MGGAMHRQRLTTVHKGVATRVLRLLLTIPVLLVTGSLAEAASVVRGSIVFNQACRESGVCLFDTLKKGSFKMIPTSKPGANGLVVAVKLSGVSLQGQPVNLTGMRFTFDVRVGYGCGPSYGSPPFDIVDGRASVVFTGQDLNNINSLPGTDPFPEGAGKSLGTFCGNGFAVHGDEPETFLGYGGIEQGDDPD